MQIQNVVANILSVSDFSIDTHTSLGTVFAYWTLKIKLPNGKVALFVTIGYQIRNQFIIIPDYDIALWSLKNDVEYKNFILVQDSSRKINNVFIDVTLQEIDQHQVYDGVVYEVESHSYSAKLLLTFTTAKNSNLNKLVSEIMDIAKSLLTHNANLTLSSFLTEWEYYI